MPKSTICSYTRDNGVSKTYEDSNWSTKTEVILVKTRCTAMKILPDSPKIPPRSSNASNSSMSIYSQETPEELPILNARQKEGRRRMAWAGLDSDECSKDPGSHDIGSVSSEYKSRLTERRRPKTSNLEIRNRLLSRVVQSEVLPRPRTAKKIIRKSNSLDKPKESQFNLVEHARSKSVSSPMSPSLVKSDRAIQMQNISTAISEVTCEQKMLPIISIDKKALKKLDRTGKELDEEDRNLDHTNTQQDQMRKKLEFNSIAGKSGNRTNDNKSMPVNKLHLEKQRYSTGNCPLLKFSDVESSFRKSALARSSSAGGQCYVNLESTSASRMLKLDFDDKRRTLRSVLRP